MVYGWINTNTPNIHEKIRKNKVYMVSTIRRESRCKSMQSFINTKWMDTIHNVHWTMEIWILKRKMHHNTTEKYVNVKYGDF